MKTRFAQLASLLVLLNGTAVADDWPQYMGPRRDSVWRETGIVRRFSDEGLKVKWEAPVGLGFAGPAVAEGRVLVLDYLKRSGELTNNPGRRDELQGLERVLCFDAETGKPLWKYEYDRPYNLSYPGGPRCTPTVAGGKVYALGAEGNLTCLDSRTGKVVWSKVLTEAYATATPMWGFAAHPLVHGDLLYCVVGGEGSVVVALNKDTGVEIWRALNAAEAGYAPPVLIEYGGAEQLLIWHPESLNSLNPQTGAVHWSIPLKPDFGMSIAAPRHSGAYLFACGIRATAALIKLDGSKPGAEVVWRAKTRDAMFAATASPIIDGQVIYGNDSNNGTLVAARLEDGARLWETRAPVSTSEDSRTGTVFLVKHEDRYFLFNETGDLILARLTPEAYAEIGRFHLLDPTNFTGKRKLVWSHPAFAYKSVFARNDEKLVCVSLAADR